MLKDKQYYLILPKNILTFEAIEEVIREQETYNKKFKGIFSRSIYILKNFNQSYLPESVYIDIKKSYFYKLNKLKNFKNNYLNYNVNNLDNFNIIISNNKQFIKWVTLKLVEIENSSINLKNDNKLNYNGLIGNYDIKN